METIDLYIALLMLVAGIAAILCVGCILGALIERYSEHKRDQAAAQEIDWQYGDVPTLLKEQGD